MMKLSEQHHPECKSRWGSKIDCNCALEIVEELEAKIIRLKKDAEPFQAQIDQRKAYPLTKNNSGVAIFFQ